MQSNPDFIITGAEAEGRHGTLECQEPVTAEMREYTSLCQPDSREDQQAAAAMDVRWMQHEHQHSPLGGSVVHWYELGPYQEDNPIGLAQILTLRAVLKAAMPYLEADLVYDKDGNERLTWLLEGGDWGDGRRVNGASLSFWIERRHPDCEKVGIHVDHPAFKCDATVQLPCGEQVLWYSHPPDMTGFWENVHLTGDADKFNQWLVLVKLQGSATSTTEP